MKLRPILIFISLLGILGDLHAEKYYLDQNHSKLKFDLDFMGESQLVGHFQNFAGSFLYDPTTQAISLINIQVNTCSIDTGDNKRDVRLKESDLFDCPKYTWANFSSSLITPSGHNSFTVEGTLQIKEIKRPIILQIEFLGADSSPGEGKTLHYSFQTRFDRQDFSLSWNRPLKNEMWLVGNLVNVSGQILAKTDYQIREQVVDELPRGDARKNSVNKTDLSAPVIPTASSQKKGKGPHY